MISGLWGTELFWELQSLLSGQMDWRGIPPAEGAVDLPLCPAESHIPVTEKQMQQEE